MPRAHRETDLRYCGAITDVIGQNNVYVNSLLWAVEDDPETHGDGQLVAVYGARNVFINSKHAIVAIGDQAVADDYPHQPPYTYPLGHSPDVYVYEGTSTDISVENGVVDQNGLYLVTDDGSVVTSKG